MIEKFLKRGYLESSLKDKILERVESNDGNSIKAIKFTMRMHVFYCAIIVFAFVKYMMSVSDQSDRVPACLFFMGLLFAQIASLLEARDWRVRKTRFVIACQ
jgi:hypothetical protein